MPYVRSHGNQVVIVHGERDKTTGKVNQRKLFTLYSKVEATAAIGDENQAASKYFRRLLEEANPDIKFNWDSIRAEIREKMEGLPDLYPLRQARSEDAFRKALDEFVRQLLLTAPQYSAAGQTTLAAHADNLASLVDVINFRMDRRYWHTRKNDDEQLLDPHDPFCWRFEVQSEEVPCDIEEVAAEHFESGRYGEARKLFELLTRCFPSYAEGYNWLGLIDLREGAPKDAIEQFRKTIKHGRNLFPKRIAKSRYWSDHSTRPFLRGMQNLGLALIQSGRFKEALDNAQQLERDCGDTGQTAARWHRAAAYLNLHYWPLSLDAAMEFVKEDPSGGFIAAFALYELDREPEAIELFLFAAMNSPHTACMLLDRKEPKSLCNLEVEDHNDGVELCRLLPRFFQMQSKQSRKFFKKLGEDKLVIDLLDEVVECTRNHSVLRDAAHITNFDRWHELQSRKFAAKTARFIMKQRELFIASNIKK